MWIRRKGEVVIGINCVTVFSKFYLSVVQKTPTFDLKIYAAECKTQSNTLQLLPMSF